MTEEFKDRIRKQIRKEYPQLRGWRFQVMDGWESERVPAVKVTVTGPDKIKVYESIKAYGLDKSIENAILEAFEEVARQIPYKKLGEYLELL